MDFKKTYPKLIKFGIFDNNNPGDKELRQVYLLPVERFPNLWKGSVAFSTETLLVM